MTNPKPGHLIFTYLDKFWEWPEIRSLKDWMLYVGVICFILMVGSGIGAIVSKAFYWLLIYLIAMLTYFFARWKFPTWLVVRCIVIWQWLHRRKNWRAYHVKVIVCKVGDKLQTFEFVPPRAKYTWVDLNAFPANCKILYWPGLPKNCEQNKLQEICSKFSGTRYDVLELFAFPLFNWIAKIFGRWYVCSTGAVRILEEWAITGDPQANYYVMGRPMLVSPGRLADHNGG